MRVFLIVRDDTVSSSRGGELEAAAQKALQPLFVENRFIKASSDLVILNILRGAVIALKLPVGNP